MQILGMTNPEKSLAINAEWTFQEHFWSQTPLKNLGREEVSSHREPVAPAGCGGAWDGHLRSSPSPLLNNTAGLAGPHSAQRGWDSCAPCASLRTRLGVTETRKPPSPGANVQDWEDGNTLNLKQTARRILDNVQGWRSVSRRDGVYSRGAAERDTWVSEPRLE